MRIAFTHNLRLSDREDEAEFDSPQTVAFLANALRGLGHEVEPVEVSGPASRLVARLEALAPDLVFNTAEGTVGRFREAFYPALFDRLSLPFTGSDAYTCALTLDKQLTKTIVGERGVPSPRGGTVHSLVELDALELRYPVIAKPNHEGSSKGITVDSVVEDADSLRILAADLLARFPTGLLVEEFITGRDVVVPFVEGASPATGGVLEPASYSFDASAVADRKFQIYDYALKSELSDAVHVQVPAEIPAEVRDVLMAHSRQVFDVLRVRDAGRIDFRIDDQGGVHFIEINALPSFEQGASIYLSSALVGLAEPHQVLECIVRTAAERFGIGVKATRRRPVRRARIGLAYNVKRSAEEADAEFDSPETIAALSEAIASYGHEVVPLEATSELPARIASEAVDAVFNIAEGFGGRSREAQVPALLEMLSVPYTGSDPTALSLSLDKALAKHVVARAGVPTPAAFVMRSGKERLPAECRFPVIAKPLHEGSSKGVLGRSVARDETELREVVREYVERYRQPLLVEGFLPGREFTVGLLGERRPKALPPLEIVFAEGEDELPTYSYAHKFEGKPISFEVPAKTSPALDRELRRVATRAFVALGCRDVARIDLRLDAEGRVNFIEANPLPGLTPGFSDLCVIAEAAGSSYRQLVGEILAPALRRMRAARREAILGRSLR